MRYTLRFESKSFRHVSESYNKNTRVNKCKRMSRTVSARIPNDLHEELRERCNLVGESINDYVKAAIEFALNETVDFDFGGELMDELEEKRKRTITIQESE